MRKQHFESKLSNDDPSGELSIKSEEVLYAKKKSHRNEFASYFESDSSSSKREIFSLCDSSSSDEHLDDDVRSVAAMMVYVPLNDDIEHLAQVSDDDSRKINGSCERKSESSVLSRV